MSIMCVYSVEGKNVEEEVYVCPSDMYSMYAYTIINIYLWKVKNILLLNYMTMYYSYSMSFFMKWSNW